LGTAYDINIKVFNELQNTITGWPGGKPTQMIPIALKEQNQLRKGSIIFSPHPDDDVISMGGTFIRLVDQGHDVHVAYQTSGNIAVLMKMSFSIPTFSERSIRHLDYRIRNPCIV
jgi:glucosamine-6-phosphate deaminase